MDGRQKSPPTCLFVIYHRAVKVVQLYKYLETVAADTFAFEPNIELLLQKPEEVLMLTALLQACLSFVLISPSRKMRSFFVIVACKNP